MSAVRFTLADLEAAADSWGCNCGPAALAAICGLTLDEVRPHFMPAFPGYTNLTRMYQALRSAGRKWTALQRGFSGADLPWPRWGLARIQWEGPWTQPGASPRWAYTHTHWIGVHTRGNIRSVWDVNEMSEAGADGWVLVGDWSRSTVPQLTRDIPHATGGWHITHAIEVQR